MKKSTEWFLFTLVCILVFGAIALVAILRSERRVHELTAERDAYRRQLVALTMSIHDISGLSLNSLEPGAGMRPGVPIITSATEGDVSNIISLSWSTRDDYIQYFVRPDGTVRIKRATSKDSNAYDSLSFPWGDDTWWTEHVGLPKKQEAKEK